MDSRPGPTPPQARPATTSPLAEEFDQRLEPGGRPTGSTASHQFERSGSASLLTQERLAEAKEALQRHWANAQATMQDAVDRNEQVIRSHPWRSVGVSASLGIVAGLLIRQLFAGRDRTAGGR